ncbi:MAG TPA: 3-keto-5-aminohexanoate cleavage protein [Candidatus Methanoperedens sp.]|nr:3-keto-5-aminohexanoate cleavage protein [Candidatus Methanoperedens sp.]
MTSRGPAPRAVKVIVNLAPTGLVPTRALAPQAPLSVREIVADVERCVRRGANLVHLHARDGRGRPTWRREVYARIIGGIRERCPDLPLCVSLSGRVSGRFEERTDALRLRGDLKPDLASLTLGSLNFARGAGVNTPEMIRRLAECLAEREIKPELEVFDLGMLNYAHYLIDRGLLRPPHYFNLLLGGVASAQATPGHLGQLLAALPPASIWAGAGFGDRQLPMNTLGLLYGHGVRVGLEDTLWFDAARRTPATNEMLVDRIVRLAAILGRKIAAPAEVRARLGLPVR